MNQVCALTIPGEPLSKARPRFAVSKRGKVRTYTPKQTEEAEDAVGWHIKKACPGIEANERDAFYVEVEFHCGDYRRRDVDNMAKLVFDACNGLVWRDDVQVERLLATVTRGSAEPRTVLRLWSFPREKNKRSKRSKK